MSYLKQIVGRFSQIDSAFHNVAYNRIDESLSNDYRSFIQDNTLPVWECVDDRFGSYFGSTYEIPTSDYNTIEDDVTITIFGDRWLTTDKVVEFSYYQTEVENTQKIDNFGIYDYTTSLYNVLSSVYINGTINRIGDFSANATDNNTLEDVFEYLQNLEEYPDYFIFNGTENTFINSDEDVDYTKNLLEQIDRFCSNNNIKAMIIYTPDYTILYHDIVKYLDVISYPIKMYSFSVYDWIINHDIFLLRRSAYYKSAASALGFTCPEQYGLYFYNCSNLGDSLTNRYLEIVYTEIKRKILSVLFNNIKRDKFYVSLAIFSNYDNFYQYKKIDKGKVDLPFKRKLSYFEYINDVDQKGNLTPIHYYSKYCTDGNLDNLTQFKNNGYIFVVCVHTGYSEDLWFCEQAQANCLDNTQKQIQDGSVITELENMLRVYKWSDIRTYGLVSPYVIPGTGCPWITVSEKNMQEYKNKDNTFTPLHIYITRDKFSASITLKLSSEAKTNSIGDVYQSIEFGRMNVQSENYKYPLYAGGGTTGLSQDIYVYTPRGSSNKTYTVGNVYNLDMDNICMSNSDILHPTKFNSALSSNFKVLGPDGIWRSIYAYKQDYQVVSYPTQGSPTPDFAIVLKDVEYNLGQDNNGVYPMLNTGKKKVSTNRVNYDYIYYNESDKVDYSGQIDKLSIVYKNTKANEEYTSIGYIPNCYVSWDNTIPSGEVTIGDKKYLSIPCGWDGRLYNYNHPLGAINNEWGNETIVNLYENNSLVMRDNQIKDKLLIELG